MARIPQSLDEITRMSPDEQREAGEILGRLMVLGPDKLGQLTKITPQELQGLMGQPTQTPPEASGAAPAQPMPVTGYTPPKASTSKSVPKTGHYGVLSNLTQEPEGLVIRDTRTGASRQANPGDKVGPTEVLMAGNDILQAGLRAMANLKIQSQKRV